LKAQTRSGDALKEEEAMFKKTISRLEKNLQMSRIKLSVSHSENMDCRNQIDSLRRDKVLYLQIQNDLVCFSSSPLLCCFSFSLHLTGE
jgi:hypothetical protein